MNRSSDLIDWLEAEPLFPKFCWSSGGMSFAAAGAKRILDSLPRKGFAYGGMRFDLEGSADASWQPFGRAQFIEPEKFKVGKLRYEESHVELEPLDSLGDWQELVHKAKEASYEKVVVARRLRGCCPNPYAQLRSFPADTGHRFLFAPDQDYCFFGSSPELLFHLDQDLVHVDAVAGTRPLTGEPLIDERYYRELLFSPKERNEHRLVVEHIEKILQIPPGEISIRKAGAVQHLLQEFVGETKMSAQELLEALHPTPAVAGAPPAFIREIEGFDRGWFAGPIGFCEPGGAMFAVAIRSALWVRGELTWFSGSGITKGSDFKSEWEETKQKSQVLQCART